VVDIKFKFVHAADLHLDSPFYGFSAESEKIQKILRDATFVAFDNLINLCIEEDVDFLVIAGDIYDEANNNIRGQYKFYEGMKRLEQNGVKVFVSHGNHDHLGGYRATIKWPENVHFFSCEKPQEIPFYKNGTVVASIHGVSYPKRDVRENLVCDFKVTSQDTYNIAVVHTNVGGRSDYENYAPCKKEELLKKGFDYWALGHVHKHEIINPAKPVIAYPGNTQARNIKETGSKGVLLVEVEDGNTSYEFKETQYVTWIELKQSITELQSGEELIEAILKKFTKIRPQKGGVIARLYLEGRGELHYELTKKGFDKVLLELLREQEEVERDGFVWVESLILQTGLRIDKAKYLQEASIVGDFLQVAGKTLQSEEFFEKIKKSALQIYEDVNKVGRYISPPSDEELKSWLQEAEEVGLQYLLEDELDAT
jgi:DNA repair exonuclease SbcCD nuclease subunit